MLKDLKRYEVFFKEKKFIKDRLIQYGMDFTQPFSISEISEPTTLKALLKKEYSESNYKYILTMDNGKCKYVNITGAKFVKEVDVKQFYRGTYRSYAEQLYTKTELDRCLSNSTTDVYLLETTKPLKEVGADIQYKSMDALLKRNKPCDIYSVRQSIGRFVRANYENTRYTKVEPYLPYQSLDRSGYMVLVYREKLRERLQEYKREKIQKLGLDYEPYLSLLYCFNTLQDTIKENIYDESNTSETIQGISYTIGQLYGNIVRIKRVLLGDTAPYNIANIEQLNYEMESIKRRISEAERKIRGQY